MLILLLAISFTDPVIEDHFDHIEVNSTYNERGDVSIKQYCFWRLTRHGRRCEDWRYFPEKGALPTKQGRVYVLLFWDNVDKVTRRVTATSFSATHTSYDPERENVKDFHFSARIPLADP